MPICPQTVPISPLPPPVTSEVSEKFNKSRVCLSFFMSRTQKCQLRLPSDYFCNNIDTRGGFRKNNCNEVGAVLHAGPLQWPLHARARIEARARARTRVSSTHTPMYVHYIHINAHTLKYTRYVQGAQYGEVKRRLITRLHEDLIKRYLHQWRENYDAMTQNQLQKYLVHTRGKD